MVWVSISLETAVTDVSTDMIIIKKFTTYSPADSKQAGRNIKRLSHNVGVFPFQKDVVGAHAKDEQKQQRHQATDPQNAAALGLLDGELGND